MLGLYVHVPFCVKKCRYCDFVSAPSDCAEREQYVDAVVSEIAWRSNRSRSCDTVFVGGGTPSVLTEKQLERIADALRRSFDIEPGAEFTVEANPESLTYEKAAALKGIGVNRLSMGFQSLSERALGVLGRVHNCEKAFEAFENARRAGFENINIDLMFGLPGEPEGEFEDTLKRVCELGPEHISAYSLIVEEGTPLAHDISTGRLPEPDDGRDRADYSFARKILEKYGYRQYEISNFAKPGFESKHNMRYWRQKEYLGFGPAAASFERGRRYSNTDDIGVYIKGCGRAEPEEDAVLSKEELMDEYMMLGFRMTEGPDLEHFREIYGVSAAEKYSGKLDSLEKEGLIERYKTDLAGVRLTEKGLDFANRVFREFV